MPPTKERREYMKEYNRLYREKNKEREREYNRLYNEKNKEKKKEQRKTPHGIRIRNYSDWNLRGVIFESDEDRDMIYVRYIESKKCEVCNKEYNGSSDRCLDHDHSITDAPNFRQILCRRCNIRDRWQNHS